LQIAKELSKVVSPSEPRGEADVLAFSLGKFFEKKFAFMGIKGREINP
jgi:hypothetical protein